MTDAKKPLILHQSPIKYNTMSQRLSPMLSRPVRNQTSTPVASDAESGLERDNTSTNNTGYSSLDEPILNTEDLINTDLSDSQEDLTPGFLILYNCHICQKVALNVVFSGFVIVYST